MVVPEEQLDKMMEEYKEGMNPEVLRLLNQLKHLETPDIDSEPIDYLGDLDLPDLQDGAKPSSIPADT